MFEEEQVRYHKKKDQSSKASKKSKHKHIYDRHIIIKFQYMSKEHYEVKQYCSICGKIGNSEQNYLISNEGRWKVYSFEELQQLYPNALVAVSNFKMALWADNISEFEL